MDYPQYRRHGLPIMSGRVESLMKQFNRHVKGTEKFWNEDRAEMILQMCAAQLSEDDRLSKHLPEHYRKCAADELAEVELGKGSCLARPTCLTWSEDAWRNFCKPA